MLGMAPLMAAAPAARAATAPAGPLPAIEPTKPELTLVSRHIQWAEAEQGIEVAKAAGFPAIAWTVRPGAHVEASNVERELPRIVELTRKAGLAAPMIITGINAPDADAERILTTMRGLGIRRYRVGTQRYDFTKEIQPQYDALRARMEALAKLNERTDTVAMFHTHSSGAIGGAGWDLWMLMRDLDPRYIGLNYDLGHVTVKGGSGVQEGIRAAHRHIQALSVKDFHWVRRPDAQPGTWPWRNVFVRPGDGMVNFLDAFKYMKSVGFTGPFEQYYEYEVPVPGRAEPMNMLGTDYRKWKLEIPVQQFAAYLKRDVDFYTDVMRQAGLA
jgi:sugar phosphate isomerase/epimerase